MTEEPERVGFDVEGPLVNPASDFAWQTYDQLLSENIKGKFPRKKCEDYDNKYDDGRYLHELNRSKRHSTGMWPPLSLALAALDGKTDEDLVDFAEKTTQLNPGTDKLMEYLSESFGDGVYLITSSYPAVALKIAEKYSIPFRQVFTNGFQPARKDLSQRKFIEEVEERSPIDRLSKDKKELDKFLTEYQNICESLGNCYENKLKLSTSFEETARYLLGKHRQLFEEVSDMTLYKTLRYLFLSEEGVMGSHRKVDAMRSVDDDSEMWIFGGDGIVDGMPIDYANCGFSINMKDGHALPFSKINVATTDVSQLIPIFDAMLNGEFEPQQLKEDLDSEKIRIFTPRDVQQDIENVKKANGEAKNNLKAQYIPVKV